MRPLFIDTGYPLALDLANDQNHSMAKPHWQSLLDALPPLITTSYVFDETVTFFNSRGYHAKAVEVGPPNPTRRSSRPPASAWRRGPNRSSTSATTPSTTCAAAGRRDSAPYG
jgi:predicted nucleic acid-binding protein